METVELKFLYTQREYVRAQRQYLIASKTFHRYDAILALVFLLFSIWNLFFSSFRTLSMILLIITIFVTLLGCYIYLAAPNLNFKQTAKFQEEYTLTFSKETIHLKTPSMESHVKWNVYSELWENDEFYFLIQAPRMYTILPKRVFKNSNDKQRFTELAQSNIPNLKSI